MQLYDKVFIDGEWVKASGSKSMTLVNPATEQPFAQVLMGTEADVDLAVAAARRAFESFSQTSVAERIALIENILVEFRRRQDEILHLISLEMGAPHNLRGHITLAQGVFESAITTLRDYSFTTRLGTDFVRREPIGACGLIVAWNWPIQLLCTKLSSALAAGCTVVAKPSGFTTPSAMLLADVLHSAGVPKGVFNLVTGEGAQVGQAIAGHPDLDLVSFTGSTRAGILIAQAAATNVKRVCQELGGKSPNIILPDADLDAAVRWNLGRAFSNSGQSCHAPSRMLIHSSQLAQVEEIIRDAASKVVVGMPEDPKTTMGPVVNAAQFRTIQSYIQSGLDEGARLACGGLGRPEGFETGYFVQPTVFVDVTPDMRIAAEEIFGPVLCVLCYDTIDEAIEIANGTVYGLGGYVWAGDRRRGYEVGARIKSGRVYLNGTPANATAPMGGYKQSGNGREMGVFGLEEYLEVKAMIGFDAYEE